MRQDGESRPRVSVLVAVYKTDPAVLRATIQSVLDQTFRDFELVLLDDGPDDPRASVVHEFCDERVAYASNERNLGITPTRNRLLELARGDYLAVLDHDDICRPDRLEKEVAWLDAHPSCGVVSSFTRLIPLKRIVERPITDRAIQIRLMCCCAVAHSAAMIRASVLRENGVRYEGEYSPSEDYRLFFSLVGKTEFHCIPEPLLDYRVHAGNTTQAQYGRMMATAARIQAEARERFPDLCADLDAGREWSSRLVVSGGWSYGNLGDDAIFEATATLLRRTLPEAKVVWPVYDVPLAAEAGLVSEASLCPSVHRLADRSWAFWMLQTVGRSVGYILWPAFPRRLYERLLRKRQIRRAARRDAALPDTSDVFRGADAYIMSGGGYFNMWPTMFDAKIRELELAHANGCRVILVGQSLGPFTDEQKAVLKRALRQDDVICVRDGESVAELKALGFAADLAPDLALALPKDVPIDKSLVTVVPGGFGCDERLLADQLAAFVRRTDGAYRLRVVQTCALWPDVRVVRDLRRLLSARGVACEFALPKTYAELLAAVEGSAWVVSRRMHGMVVGWRSGSSVFALTTSRKIVGFLSAVGQSENICPECDWNVLSERLVAALARPAPPTDLRRKVASEVEGAFRRSLRRAGL